MEAIIFVGMQASGKSTFYKERFFDTHVRINLDMLRTRHRERLLLHTCIEMKQRFVVDNTNPTSAHRAGYIAPTKAAGFAVVGYYFDASVSECVARNNTRVGAARIPVVGIYSTAKKLQAPSLSEGFDTLYYVRIDGRGGFVVEERVERETDPPGV
ncbi:MAG: AAA family ATPase [Chloroflexota bacterium]